MVDLGLSPLCETFIKRSDENKPDPFYPLKVWVCHACYLAQLDVFESPEEIFTEYAYFSSFSSSWLAHASAYAFMVVTDYGINKNSFVVELASNDGYLLKNFVAKGIRCLGIEPAANVARVGFENHAVPYLSKFFGLETAREVLEEHGPADLILGNNVLAHVPDINDFVAGAKRLLAPEGFITYEFPYLTSLVTNNQFDTIYHEHFSYLSLTAVQNIFHSLGLKVFEVQVLPSHGGSLRVFACHADSERLTDVSVGEFLAHEAQHGVLDMAYYEAYAAKVARTKRIALEGLIKLKNEGKRIVGYGAPGKGNTFLNYCSIGKDFIDYTVDKNPYKHGRMLPGTRIPINPPETLYEDKPDYILILPWNLKKEIADQLEFMRARGTRFITCIPELEIF